MPPSFGPPLSSSQSSLPFPLSAESEQFAPSIAPRAQVASSAHESVPSRKLTYLFPRQHFTSPKRYARCEPSPQYDDPYRFLTSGSSYPGRHRAVSSPSPSQSSFSSYECPSLPSEVYRPYPFAASPSHPYLTSPQYYTSTPLRNPWMPSPPAPSPLPSWPRSRGPFYPPEEKSSPLLFKAIVLCSLALLYLLLSPYFPIASEYLASALDFLARCNPFLWPRDCFFVEMFTLSVSLSYNLCRVACILAYATAAACVVNAINVHAFFSGIAMAIASAFLSPAGLAFIALLATVALIRHQRKPKPPHYDPFIGEYAVNGRCYYGNYSANQYRSFRQESRHF